MIQVPLLNFSVGVEQPPSGKTEPLPEALYGPVPEILSAHMVKSGIEGHWIPITVTVIERQLVEHPPESSART